MADELIVYEYLQDAACQINDPQFLSQIDSVTNLVSQLIELASFLLEKIKNGRQEVLDLQAQLDDLLLANKAEVAHWQDSLFHQQILLQEETQKQQNMLSHICSLEEELGRTKYHSLLIQNQLSHDQRHSESMLALIQDLQAESYALKKDLANAKAENAQLKSSQLELRLSVRTLNDELTKAQEDRDLAQNELHRQSKRLLLRNELLRAASPQTAGSFLTPMKLQPEPLQQKFTRMKQCLSHSINYSLRCDQPEEMLKTDTDIYEPPVKEFLQMSIQSMQQNDSHNSSPLKQHFFSRSRAVTVLLANEIQLPDTTLKPNELAFEQPDNFQTIVSNFTTIPIETNISPQPVPIPQDPEIKSVRTLHTMKSQQAISFKSIRTSKDSLVTVNQDFITQFKNNFALPLYAVPARKAKSTYKNTITQLASKVNQLKHKSTIYSMHTTGIMRLVFGLK